MFNRTTLMVGTRYALSHRHSHLVSFISLLSIVGLIIGVALLVLVMSIMNGFDRELRERILGIMPQATLHYREGIEDPDQLIQLVKRHPQVVDAAPFVQLQGLLSHRRQVAPVNLYGIAPKQESQLTVLEAYLPDDAFAQLAAGDSGLLLGRGLADTLGAVAGDRITLIVPRRGGGRDSPNIRVLSIVAVFDSGTEIDHALALMNLDAASGLTEYPGRATGIRLQLHDLFAASAVIQEIVRDLPFGYYGSNWTRTHGNLYQAIQMSKRLVGLLVILIVGIAAFNLVATLIMVVVDKQGDIAILRTLGASGREIIGVFMVQGGLIGLLGTALGVLIGVLLSLGVTDFVDWLETALGIQFLQSDVYPISYLPAELYWPDVLTVALVALALSLSATLYPAWRASRVQPAEALQHE